MTKQASSLPAQILAASSLKAREDHLQDARRHVDELFPDLDELLEHAHTHTDQAGGATISSSSTAVGIAGADLSRTSSRTGAGHAYQPGRRGKRRRTLNEEIAHWEREEAAASAEVEKTSKSLPALLAETQTKLQTLLSTAQKLSLERHTLTDQLSGLVDGLDAPVQRQNDAVGGEAGEAGTTLLQQMADLQDELARLEAGLTWATVLEKVLSLSEQALAPSAHSPSPVAALPMYETLHNLVDDLLPSLPGSMALVGIIVQIRETTWTGLQDALSRNLLNACDTIKWPTKISYQALPPQERRTFERAFADMLFFQAEGRALRDDAATADWTSGSSVLPVAVLAKPVELRFQYHFMGNKSTNRLDKPEWAFASLLDTLYQQSPFLTSTISTLTRCSDPLFREIDVRAEFTLSLLSTALSLLRLRIPKILDKPSLLAHTIYQTIVFDDAIRQGGFDLARTTYGRRLAERAVQREGADGQSGAGDKQIDEGQGLTGVVLRESGWYEHWVKGEKQFVDTQMHDIIASSDAWTITDDAIDEDDGAMDGQRPTVSARQVKALIEQVTDRYLPLPELRHRLPFLLSIQLPALQAYHQRISGSLDAFENLSSAFARAIPGALSGNTRGGAHFDQSKLTGGEAGLARLIKAQLSAAWLMAALKGWADEPFFVELSADAQKDTAAKWTVQSDAHLSFILDAPDGASVFDRSIQQFEALCDRAQDMMIRLVTVEVESHLREHLKRRWDSGTGTSAAPSAHLLSALSTYSTLLRLLTTDLPPLIVSRLYRRIVSHLTNHIFQRAVYSGWSKFTAEGGKEFADEVRDFVSASTDIMSSAHRTGNAAIMASLASVEAPWRSLSDASRVLQLPEHEREGKAYEGEVTFKQAMAAAWADGEESMRVFQERSGTRMPRGELQGILRRRVECWK